MLLSPTDFYLLIKVNCSFDCNVFNVLGLATRINYNNNKFKNLIYILDYNDLMLALHEAEEYLED